MDSTLRTVRNILNKLTVNNIYVLFLELDEQSKGDYNLTRTAFETCLQNQLSSDIKLLDFQLLCLAGISALFYARELQRLKYFMLNSKISNHTNQFRFLGFLYMIKAFDFSSTVDLLVPLIETIKCDVEPLINLFQLCALQMRTDDPEHFVDVVDKIFGMVECDATSSRGRFFMELIEEIRTNNSRILKKYVNAELDTVTKQLQSVGRQADSKIISKGDHKRIKGLGTPLRMRIFEIISKAHGLEDVMPKLLSVAASESFDYDIWFVSHACLIHETVYNPFYAALCAELSNIKYKIRKTLKLFLRSMSKEIESKSYKNLYFSGKFLGELYSRSRVIPTAYLSVFCSSSSTKSDILLISCFSVFSDASTRNVRDQDTEQNQILLKYCKRLIAKTETGYLSSHPDVQKFASNTFFIN